MSKFISSAQLSAREDFFQKNTTSGKRLTFNTSRLFYMSTLPLKSPIFLSRQWAQTINRKRFFGTKPLPCRRFLQHYYRDTFIESHRKPIEVPQISYRGHLICSMPLPSKQKEVFTQILQIIHHFKYHSLRVCKFFCIFAANYKTN